ncbi:MAG: hypothetical protein PHI97_17710 [Desulfobulbus sp.]|nr:hypothetical protein [Desulfobulbus sp.]
MKLNRIQIQILKKLSQDKDLEVDSYIQQYAQEFLCAQKDCLQDLSEEEGDAWINKAYIQSLTAS